MPAISGLCLVICASLNDVEVLGQPRVDDDLADDEREHVRDGGVPAAGQLLTRRHLTGPVGDGCCHADRVSFYACCYLCAAPCGHVITGTLRGGRRCTGYPAAMARGAGPGGRKTSSCRRGVRGQPPRCAPGGQ